MLCYIDQRGILFFPTGLNKIESESCISWDWLREMNAGGSCDLCWCLSFFGLFRPDLSPWGHGNKCFLVALRWLLVRRLNLEVATKMLLRAWKCCVPAAIFGGVEIPEVRGCHLLRQANPQWRSQKLFQDRCLMNSEPNFLIFTLFLAQWNGYIIKSSWTIYFEYKIL